MYQSTRNRAFTSQKLDENSSQRNSVMIVSADGSGSITEYAQLFAEF